METRHINYKSDFVIRERFRDGTGKVVALPDVDFELRYWVGSKTVTASRKNGVFANCVADGDALLVIFKDHGLGEGELHHELHLALDNALFCILKDTLIRLLAAIEKITGEALELRTGKRIVEVLRACCIGCDERKVDFRLRRSRKLHLRLLSSFL